MACDLFKNGVRRNSEGNVETVERNGKPSKLYKDILNKVVSGATHMTEYLETYAQNLVDRGFLKANPESPEDMSSLSPRETALALYSRIFTPTFKDDFGDWEKSSRTPEPELDEIEELLYEPLETPPSEVQSQRLDTYDTDVLQDLAPEIKGLIEDGIDSDDLYEELSLQGFNINKAVLDRMFQAADSVQPASSLLATDIKNKRFRYKELLAIYQSLGLSKGYIQDRIKKAEIKEGRSSIRSSGRLGDVDLSGRTKEEKKKIIRNTVQSKQKAYVADTEYQMTERDGTEIGETIKGIKHLRRFGRNLMRDMEARFDRQNLENVMSVIASLWGHIEANGMTVVLHENGASYANALDNKGIDPYEKSNTSGFIADGEIHLYITTPLMSGQVAAHEILHPIVEQLMADNENLFEQFREVLEESFGIAEDAKFTEAEKLEVLIDLMAEKVVGELGGSTGDKLKQSGLSSMIEDVQLKVKNNKFISDLVRRVTSLLTTSTPSESAITLEELIGDTENGASIIKKLVTNLANKKGIKVRKSFIENEDIRFSMSDTVNKYRIFRNIIVGNPDTFLDEGYEMNGRNVRTHTQMLVDIAKELDINPAIISRIYQDLRNSREDFKTAEDSTLLKRINSGNLAKFDARTIRGIRDYLVGRQRERLPDIALERFFQHYSRSVGGYKEMADHILKSLSSLGDNPSVKFFLLDRILVKGIYEITPAQKRHIVDEIEKIRSEAGRTMRLMKSEHSLALGPIKAIQTAKEHKDLILEKLGFNEIVNTIRNMMSPEGDTANKVVAAITNERIRKMFNNYTLEEFEIRSTLIQEGLEQLLEMKARNPFVKEQMLTAEQRLDEEADPSSYTDKDWADVAFIYVHNMSGGDVMLAKEMFAKAYPLYTSKFNLYRTHQSFNPDALKKEQSTNAENFVMSWLREFSTFKEGNVRIDRDGNTVPIGDTKMVPNNGNINSNSIGRILRQAAIELGLDTNRFPDFNDVEQGIPMSEAMFKIRHAIAESNTLTIEDILYSALNSYENLIREKALAPDSKKSKAALEKLKADKAYAESLLKKVTMAYGEDSSAAYKESSEQAIRRTIINTVQEFLGDSFGGHNLESVPKNSLLSRLIKDLDTPPQLIQLVEQELSDVLLEELMVEEKVEEALKSTDMRLTRGGVNKMMKMFANGIFDRDAAVEAFADQNRYDFLEAFGGIPRNVEYKLVKLQNRYRRANTTYEKNRVSQEASKIVADLTNMTLDRWLFTSLTSLGYMNMLSSLTTSAKAMFSGVSTSAIQFLSMGTVQFASLIRDVIFQKDTKKYKYFLKTIRDSFSDFTRDEETGEFRGKGHFAAIYDTFYEDLQTTAMTRRTNLPEQTSNSSPLSMYFSNIVKKRWEAIKAASKGDFKKAVKIFVGDLLSGDLGSSASDAVVYKMVDNRVADGLLNEKGKKGVQKVLSKGIRISSFLLPIVMSSFFFTTSAPIILSSTFFVMGMMASNAYILAKVLPLTDYFLSSQNREIAANVAAFDGVSHLYDNASAETADKIYEKQKRRMGMSLPQASRVGQMIKDKFPDYLEEVEAEKGRELTPKELKKAFKDFSLKEIINYKDEYRNVLDVNQGQEVANSAAVIGTPAGRLGKVTLWWKSMVQTMSDSSKEHLERSLQDPNYSNARRSAYLVAETLFKIGLNLTTVPFLDVMVNLFQRAYEHTIIGGMVNYGQWLFADRDFFREERHVKDRPNEKPIRVDGKDKIYAVSRTRALKRAMRPILGTAMQILVFTYLFDYVEPGDEEDDEDLVFGRFKIDFDREIWKHVRVTGPGTGSMSKDAQPADGYDPLALQVKFGGQWHTIIKYIDHPTLSPLIAIGKRYDEEIFGKGKVALAVKEEGYDMGLVFNEILNTAIMLPVYAIGQNFNPGINEILDTFMEATETRDDDKSTGQILEKGLQDLASTPVSTMLTPNSFKAVTRTFKFVMKEPLKKHNKYGNTTPMDKVVRHTGFGEDWYSNEPVTDGLGYPIMTDLPVNPEAKIFLNLLIDFQTPEERLKEESPFHVFAGKHTAVKVPYNTGMWPSVNMSGKNWGGTLPQTVSTLITENSKPIRRELLEDEGTIEALDNYLNGTLSRGQLLLKAEEGLFNVKEKYILDAFKELEGKSASKFMEVNNIINKLSQQATDRAKTKVFYELMSKSFGEGKIIAAEQEKFIDNPIANEFTWSNMNSYMSNKKIKFVNHRATGSAVISMGKERVIIPEEALKDYFDNGELSADRLIRSNINDFEKELEKLKEGG